MRFLKNSFAAIIALVAISATLASYAGAFSKTVANAAVEDGCYPFVETIEPKVFQQGDPCTSAPLPPNDVVLQAVGLPINPADCFEPLTNICCVEVENDRIVDIVCGEYIP